MNMSVEESVMHKVYAMTECDVGKQVIHQPVITGSNSLGRGLVDSYSLQQLHECDNV